MNKGYSLIAFLVYVSLLSLFLTGAVGFALNVVYGGVKARTLRDVSDAIRFVNKRIAYEIRNARAINSVGAHSLCLSSPDSAWDPTFFYVSSGRLRIGRGGGDSTCTTLLVDEPITSSLVTVTDLSFVNLSSPDSSSQHVQFSLTIAHANPGNSLAWERSATITTSAELRISPL